MQLMPWIRPTRLAVFLTHAILWYFPFLIPTFHCEIYPARRQSDEIWGKRNIIWSFKKFPKFESLLRYDIRRLQKSFEPTNNFRLLVFKRQFILSLVIHRRTRWPLFDIFDSFERLSRTSDCSSAAINPSLVNTRESHLLVSGKLSKSSTENSSLEGYCRAADLPAHQTKSSKINLN